MPTNVNTKLTALIAIIITGLLPELTSGCERREDVCEGDLTRCMIFCPVDSTPKDSVSFFFLAEGLLTYQRMFLFCIDLTFCGAGTKNFTTLLYRENRILNKEYRNNINISGLVRFLFYFCELDLADVAKLWIVEPIPSEIPVFALIVNQQQACTHRIVVT